MRRQLQTWGLGLVAASPWALGVARLYTNPADPAVDVRTLWLAGLVWLVAVVTAGRLAARDPDGHAGSGAWAGANVGALAWLLGAAPVLGAWSQRSVLAPTVGPDVVAVMMQAVAEATVLGLVWPSASATWMVGGGAALGWAASGRWREAWRAPDGVLILAALWLLPTLSLVGGAIEIGATPLVDSVRQGAVEGALLGPVPWARAVVPSALSPVTVGLAWAAAFWTVALRVRGGRARVGLGAAAVGALGASAGMVASWAPAVLPVVFGAVLAGMACGASVAVRPGGVRPLGVALLELTPTFATIGSGAPAVLAGLAAAIGATRRIPALSADGAAAPADGTVTPELLAIWGQAAPVYLVTAACGVAIAWVGSRAAGRYLRRWGPERGVGV